MSFLSYLKDKIPGIIISGLLLLFLATAFTAFKLPTELTAFVLIVSFLVLLFILFIDYPLRYGFYKNLQNIANQLDQKTLLNELILPPYFTEGRILYSLLTLTAKDMNDTISKYRRETQDYREYIEAWVHEIKTPIASIDLMLANRPGEDTAALKEELNLIEDYVRQALFYARSSSLAQDYIIRPVGLADCINPVLRRQARRFINGHIALITDGLDTMVRTDAKWVSFIVGQLIENALKYVKTSPSPQISITACQMNRLIRLSITDNGCGIPPEDLPRVCDKGFTGQQGHQKGSKATGIGLYLCKRLCDKMGLSFSICSEFGHGTTATIDFPAASMSNVTKP